jgi:hypothetical protein
MPVPRRAVAVCTCHPVLQATCHAREVPQYPEFLRFNCGTLCSDARSANALCNRLHNPMHSRRRYDTPQRSATFSKTYQRQAAHIEIVHQNPIILECSILRLSMVISIVDLLGDTRESKQAEHFVETPVAWGHA